MSTISIRKDEIDAVEAVMQDDTYASPTAMARAVVKTLYEFWRRRDWYVIAVREGETYPLFYGLEATENSAFKEAQSVLEVGGLVSAHLVHSLTKLDDRKKELEAIWGASDLCAKCGHAQWAHELYNGRGEKVPQPSRLRFSCSARCRCPGFTLVKEEAAT